MLIPNSSAYREEENFIFPITIHPDVSGYVILLHSCVSIIDVRPTLRMQPPARSVDARKSSHSHRMNVYCPCSYSLFPPKSTSSSFQRFNVLNVFPLATLLPSTPHRRHLHGRLLRAPCASNCIRGSPSTSSNAPSFRLYADSARRHDHHPHRCASLDRTLTRPVGRSDGRSVGRHRHRDLHNGRNRQTDKPIANMKKKMGNEKKMNTSQKSE